MMMQWNICSHESYQLEESLEAELQQTELPTNLSCRKYLNYVHSRGNGEKTKAFPGITIENK